MMIVRLGERIGIAVLVASAAALPGVGWLLWHRRPALGIAEAAFVAGLIAGVIWGIVRRPSAMAALLEADRQMKTAELLSSAWLCWRRESYRDNRWATALLGEAELRCAKASAASLRFQRLGGRTWGAVVLSAALVFTVALLGPAPAVSTSHDNSGSAGHLLALGQIGHDAAQSADVFTSPDNRPVLLADPDDPHASTFGQNEQQRAAKVADATAAAPSDAHSERSSANEGTGAGAGRTQSPTGVKPGLSTAHVAAGSATVNKGTLQFGGAGASSNKVQSGIDVLNGLNTAAAVSRSDAPPPWNAADWSSSIQRAQIALTSGHIPDAYRDLVRGYFAE